VTALGVEALIVVASSAHGPEGHLGLPRGGMMSDDAHDHLTDARAASQDVLPEALSSLPTKTSL